MSDSLQPRGLQQARLLCSSLCPGVCSNPRSLSRRCHPTILSSVIPFSSCPQSFPASVSFPLSASVLPLNIQSSFPLGLTGLISPQSKGLSRTFSRTTIQITQVNSLNSHNSKLQMRKPRHRRSEVVSHS